MKKKFFLCGTIGWCMEILFTSTHSILEKNFQLTGYTSLWMFPIYGMAAFLFPVYKYIKRLHIFLRGSIYTLCIFITEYCTGSFLKQYHLCPWDYSKAKLNIQGVIRLDFAPLWFLVGLVFEHILTHYPRS